MYNNKAIKVYNLNPLTIPLKGKQLIEASAGTGKTHTIILLYLRLLLGIGKKNIFHRPLMIKEILVVTFTEKATNELKKRIKNIINQMIIICKKKKTIFPKNSIYYNLLLLIKNKDVAKTILIKAEQEINEAAIYTIHSFCYKILINNIFESKIPLKHSIITNDHILQKEACIDFWRSQFYPLEYNIIKIIMEEWKQPEELLQDIKPYLQGEMPNFINNNIKCQSIQKCHEIIINTISIFKKKWLINIKFIFNTINNLNITKNIHLKKDLNKLLKIINRWANSITINYTIPKELAYFSLPINILKNIQYNNIVQCNIFHYINDILSQSFSLREFIISKATIEIRKQIKKKKQQFRIIGFDDLPQILEQALNNDKCKHLANKICKLYPVTMIDEFQDVNQQQYNIFQNIYDNNNNYCLLMIGDPKQAIYGFRGGDIFNYFKIKNNMKKYYTINTNWRSSSGMVAAINKLFNFTKNPFLFKNIKFIKIKSTISKKKLDFIHKKQKISALSFHFLDKKNISIFDYEQTMAYHCANQILNWLKEAENGNTWIYVNNIKKIITPNDILILVRNHYEAAKIKEALNQCNISSVFLSNKESVFHTHEASDLIWILKAIILPNDKTIRCALSTQLMDLSLKEIEQLNTNEYQLSTKITEFNNYLLIWQKYGIGSMLKTIMIDYKIFDKLLTDNINGKRRLIDIRHLSELLQEIDLQSNHKNKVIEWFMKQIEDKNNLITNHLRRLDSNKNLIHISTIHKSKGLEYNIVWLPFACNFSQNKTIIFHDRKNFKKFVDLTKNKINIKLANEEYLSENLRLLYVALTRAVYHCSIGIAHIIKKNVNNNNLYYSALLYLLQNKDLLNSNSLYNILNTLTNKNISINFVKNTNILSPRYLKNNQINKFHYKNLTKKIQNFWQITSYSKLINPEVNDLNHKQITTTNYISIQYLISQINVDIYQKNNILANKTTEMNVHNFPTGITSGLFLHSILKSFFLKKKIQKNWLIEKIKLFNLPTYWIPILELWLFNILNTPLMNNNLTLSNIKKTNQISEMEFYLPIKKILKSSSFNTLSNRYDLLSQRCNPLYFKPIQGILKGYIDLFFYWNKKFYLIDYKSNWLGENISNYNQKSIEYSMIQHRYDLQYQLYTLAIHRYLKKNKKKYNYKKHFGGVFFVYIRGININKPCYSIYHTIPHYEFIKQLEKLFNY